MENIDFQWNEEQQRGAYPHKDHQTEIRWGAKVLSQSGTEEKKNLGTAQGVEAAKQSLRNHGKKE